MMGTTKIEWSDYVFNPWRGCVKVSAGCANCYAERWSKRKPNVFGTWGPAGARVVASDSYWRQPVIWNRKAEREGVRHRVFCGSMMDFFEPREELLVARARAARVMEETPCLDWLILTKRPQHAWRQWPWMKCDGTSMGAWPRNVWLGYSASTQADLDTGLENLLACPVAVHFLSLEPLLVNLELPLGDEVEEIERREIGLRGCGMGMDGRSIDWVIVGGESGPNARPMHPDWARSIRDQCQMAGVAFFFKQHGEWLHESELSTAKEDALFAEGIDWPNFPASRVREWPDGSVSYRVGKHAAGRLLDGREWNEMPKELDLAKAKRIPNR